MKKISIAFAVFAALFVSLSPVFADYDPNYQEFQMYTVASDTSSFAVTEFELGSTPYLYIQLPNPPGGFWYSRVESDWWNGDQFEGEADRTGFQSIYHISLTGHDWSDSANIGTWTINAGYWYNELGFPEHNISSGSGFTTFTMKNTTAVPEPISTILFLAGGSALFGRRFLKRR
ncbi:MAG TPA: PEP-CTERM sorting domain-containing protein [Candidatus Omnitrophota bacterium]|nr:PEP-CTERM sorting domain-containing protein [Candidatus Omnitrophota bacterium]HOX09525.1 PEP-CTERM sorting domain-containing protein [Candidatus Omnitrophota bacterium]HPN66232.1 PEP-CTERM sorting domain-containing protein [Candidatus Omnitrophota bacterium]HRZ67601.1 PEP-CTERM sorting domain-containing protein [Candidatus Omnitrophota bacterium]